MWESEEQQTDADVVAGSLDASHAIGELFDRHYVAIYRFFARRVSVEVAEELAAEVFAVALRALRRYDTKRQSALPWLYGIAANVLRNSRRADRRRAQAETRLLELFRLTAPSGHEAHEAAVVWADLSAALGRLPEVEREILQLRVWENLSYDEISQVLDLPLGTVKSRLNRTRTMLRELSGFREQERGRDADR
jgi:RNA polymerase sigma-70 factor (ECF subfamily)